MIKLNMNIAVLIINQSTGKHCNYSIRKYTLNMNAYIQGMSVINKVFVSVYHE